MSEKVSIVVPVYNTEKYLEKCLESIINQTYTNLEIILINDGSIDKSLLICEEFSKKDSRIKLLNQKNKGVSIARNNGIKHANGVYILFVDSDDYLDGEMVEKLILSAKLNNADLVQCSNFLLKGGKIIPDLYEDEQGVYNKQEFQNNYIQNHLINGNVAVVLWNKLFKIDIIKSNNLKFHSTCLEDYLFILQYSQYVKNYNYIQDRLYYYRIIDNSLSRSFNLNIYTDLKNIDIKKREILEEYYPSKKNEMDEWFFNYVKQILFLLCLKGKTMNSIEKKLYIKHILEDSYLNEVLKNNYIFRRSIIDNLIRRKRKLLIYYYYYILSFIYILYKKIK